MSKDRHCVPLTDAGRVAWASRARGGRQPVFGCACGDERCQRRWITTMYGGWTTVHPASIIEEKA